MGWRKHFDTRRWRSVVVRLCVGGVPQNRHPENECGQQRSRTQPTVRGVGFNLPRYRLSGGRRISGGNVLYSARADINDVWSARRSARRSEKGGRSIASNRAGASASD